MCTGKIQNFQPFLQVNTLGNLKKKWLVVLFSFFLAHFKASDVTLYKSAAEKRSKANNYETLEFRTFCGKWVTYH